MDVGRLEDVIVVCDAMFSMRLGFIQAWIYQRTFCIFRI